MNKLQKTAIATGLALGAGAANAALPADAAAAFTAVSGNVTDILTAVWPIVISLTTGFILIKLFKKGVTKAT